NEIADDAYTNNTNTTVIVTYTIVPVSADGCEGEAFDVNLTISPEPILSTNLDGIACSDAQGVPQIEVNFDIDANGILKVKALDLGTGREQSIEISNTGGLNEAEIQRMQQEAEIYAEQDIQQQKLAELRNQADTLLYNYEATIKEHGDFIDEQLATELEESYEHFKQVLINSRTENNYDQLNQHIEEFRKKLFALGETLYDQSGGEKIDSPEKGKITQLPIDSEITEEETSEKETLEEETNTPIDSNLTKKEATSVKVEKSTEEPESEFGKNPFL
ncbi:MAG: Hsp70 family protein, partial [Okeania sp. SIO4D6]|nr:Hsp70 family protein [Okeania sp. SIO4D6]